MKRFPLSILPLGLAVAAWLVPAVAAAEAAAKPEGGAAAAASAEPVKPKATGFRLFGKKKGKVAETTAASVKPAAAATAKPVVETPPAVPAAAAAVPAAAATAGAEPVKPKATGFRLFGKKKEKAAAVEPAKPAVVVPAEGAAAAGPVVAEKKPGFFARLFGGRGGSGGGGETDKDAARRSAAEVAFLEECGALAAPGSTVTGRDGWLFSGSELSVLAKAGGTGTAIGVMADYASQVRGLGCDVIVVPVPPKALVYPDKVVRKAKIPVKRKVVPRLDSSWVAALKALESRGMTTVDLLPVFLAHRGDKEGAPYTQTGNTWSPRGVQLAAEAVAAAVKRSRAAKVAGSVQGISAEPGAISYTGSLAAGANPAVKAETLTLRNIGRISGDKVRSVSFSTSGGGLLLMGDSSILAWRESGNPAGSGGSFSSLADQVAAELQAIPDVLSVPGDGRNAPRLRIMRERTSGRGTLSGTKAIVWVIPMTDLASPAWQQVPLQLSFSLDQPEIMLR
jgi:alginate O-acetyltransferase complex protein AlgJ